MTGRIAATVVTAALLVLAAMPAWADVADAGVASDIAVLQVAAEPDGTTRATVRVSGLEPGDSVQLDQLEIVENGTAVDDVRIAQVETEETGAVTPAVVVALDTSGSTDGAPIEAATAAAVDLVEEVTSSGGLAGVVGFGETTSTIAPLSATPDAAVTGITALEASGGTALYDGVARASRILASHDGPRDLVVFSDGEDTVSQTTLNEVRALLAQTDVRVTAVVLRTENFAVAPLEAMADVNGGQVVEVTGAAELGDAFEAIAGDLTNRLTVVWSSEAVESPPSTLNVVATYTVGDTTVSDGVQVDNPRLPAITPPVIVEPPSPLVPAFASTPGLAVAAATAGVAAFILLYLVLAGASDRRRRHELEDRLALYQPGVQDQGREDRPTFSERASGMLDVVPRPANLDSRIATSIEKADWPLRASEFILVSLLSGLLGLLIGGVLFGSVALGVLGLLAGVAGPWVYLQVAISRRQAEFADQLPVVLQVIAGALRAGHAFSTALEGAADEVDEPARSELRRASIEGRLGRPLDRALEGVATRMDSEDLQWVIGALEVQREVGGNLAEILSNVAATLRDRASVVRHVKALTAEGRLSAVFISAMPFAMFGYLAITNPDYIRPLYAEPIGRVMSIAAIVLLVIGIVVLRRLVRPKY